jgi:hypothetical protein
VSGSFYRRISRATPLALIAVWIVASVGAGASITPAMHCQGHNMPCCPPAGSSSAQCAGAQCLEQIPQKSESRAATSSPALRMTAAADFPAPRHTFVPVHELTPGLRFPSSVFRLKDDLRT